MGKKSLHFSIMFCTLVVVLVQTTLSSAEVKRGKSDLKEAARHYDEGKKARENGDFEKAMAEMKEAYNLSGKVDILFNLALCAEEYGKIENALAYYELYLEENPRAKDADYVRSHIEELEEKLAKQETRKPDPLSVTGDEDTVSAAESPEGNLLTWKTEEEQGEKKNGVYVPALVIGAGGLILASGSLTAIMAYKKYKNLESSCAPTCDEKKVDRVKGTAIAADIQFVIGAAAVVSGTILAIWKKRSEKAGEEGETKGDDTFPSAFLAPAPGGAALVIEGSF